LVGAASVDVEQLYDAHVDDVYRVLSRLGVPTSELEDAVQETFIVAHRRWHSFRQDEPARPWLLGIAVKVAKTVRRTRARKGEFKSLDDCNEIEGSGRPDEAAMNRQALRQVMALLDKLPNDQREVMVLIELEGMTAKEVSAITQTPVNTVYTRLRSARIRFEALAEALDPGEGS
jgi:RNA polymerase sigma-70 factor (ECF subfamily)